MLLMILVLMHSTLRYQQAGKKENADYLKSLGLKANENLFYGGSLE